MRIRCPDAPHLLHASSAGLDVPEGVVTSSLSGPCARTAARAPETRTNGTLRPGHRLVYLRRVSDRTRTCPAHNGQRESEGPWIFVA